MLANPANGSTYIRVEIPRLKAPWPAYDDIVASENRTEKWVADKIAAVSEENGYPMAEVIAYETENLNRPLVIEALTEVGVLLEAEAEQLVQA